MNNNLDKTYTDLLQDILDNGVTKETRNGGTISIFGRQIRHKMSDGFPLLTTKRIKFDLIVTELLWFLRGETNIKYLVDNGCHIWDGDAYKNYVKFFDSLKYSKPMPLSQEEFINTIKTDNEFAKEWGNLGSIYGKQWRQWQGWLVKDGKAVGSLWYDQIARLIHSLKTNPDSRRLMVNAWNVGELDQMVLPPCHYGFQVYTRELSLDERKQIFEDRGHVCDLWPFNGDWGGEYDGFGIPTRAISLMYNARSQDVPLGTPFNIASYALLLEIIAKEVNMVPDELIANMGDCHIYLNQIEGVKEQLTREPYPLPTLNINTEFWQTESGECGVGPLKTNLQGFEISDFTIEGYQSHSAIKIPLSN